MRNGILALIAILTFGVQTANACDMHGITGIVEENGLWIGTDAKGINTITEEEFNQVLDRVESIYSPIIAERGKTLDVIRKWEDGTVNAYAQQTGNVWKISMFGGLARHDAITADGFALVACHELGHHIGGAPKKSSWFGTSWASNEGQSDYFGNSKCLRKFMEVDDNIAMMATVDVPEYATKVCMESFSNAEDIAMCQRGAMAGLSLGNLFKALRNLTTDLKFDTPDTGVVTTTNHNHPAPQCRLDTYFAGAVCDKDAYTDPSSTNAATGYCTRADDYTNGVRPLCWYKAP
tara:strand:+ start:55635 stop:56510 length:876 start_codon:yes stop_codon:yes gene_type:complete